MIYVKLIGGLGNQMFQYSAGRALASRLQTELVLDTSHLKIDPNGSYTIRHYELDQFDIQAKVEDTGAEKVFRFNGPWIFRKIKARFPTFFKKVIFNEDKFNFLPAFNKLPETTYLNGYWQSEKYFSNIRSQLLHDFSLKFESKDFLNIKNQILQSNSVSLHIRHGDYVSLTTANQFHGVLPLTYYQNAIDYLMKINTELKFFIFSDDIDWCIENLVFLKNAIFVEGSNLNITAQEELILMSKCQHNVIANSSFSWWAAWLNTNQNKVVIAPRSWFNKTYEQPNDLIPSTWIRL